LYLLDTNIWLERLLDQEKSDLVGRFLNHVSSEYLFITDFALHSIAVIMGRLGENKGLLRFVDDLFENNDTNLIHLDPVDFHSNDRNMKQYKLDFDDAYQYTAAIKFGLQLISFDSDFDRTERKRKTPDQITADS